jgi:hypothetical protein
MSRACPSVNIPEELSNVMEAWQPDPTEERVSTLRKQLAPILTSLKLVGQYRDGTRDCGDAASVNDRSSKCPRPNFLKLYSFVLLIISWLNVVRSILSIWVGGAQHVDIIFRIVFTIWHVQTALNSTILCRLCRDRGQISEFFCMWENQCTPAAERLGLCLVNTKKKTTLVLTIVAWMLVGTNVGGTCFIVFINIEKVSDEYAALLTGPFAPTLALKFGSFVMMLLTSCAWVFPVALFMSICVIVQSAFTDLNKRLDQILQDAGDKMPSAIGDVRMAHLKLSNTVSRLDSGLGYLMANWYGTTLPLLCLVLYTLVNDSLAIANTVMFVFWFVAILSVVVVTSVTPAWVHNAVSILNMTIHTTLDVKLPMHVHDVFSK